MKTLMKKHLQHFKAYDAETFESTIKLDANENTYPLPEEVKVHMAKWCMEMPIHLYPDTACNKLRAAIAKAYGLTKEQVICGVGSDQLIDTLLRCFVDEEDYVVAPTPSFSMYKLSTQLNEGKLIEVPLKEDFTYDEANFVACLRQYDPKLVFLCTPNNPTGCVVSESLVRKVLENTTGVVVIDEAYGEFDEGSYSDWIHECERLIVLRTFSKAYGLAGARIGYGMAQEALIRCLEVIKPPYHLNRFTQELASYVITHRHVYEPCIEKIKQTREKVREFLEEQGFKVYASQANFLWIEGVVDLERILKTKGISIRQFKIEDKAYYRLSIGTEEEMKQVMDCIKEARHEGSMYKKRDA